MLEPGYYWAKSDGWWNLVEVTHVEERTPMTIEGTQGNQSNYCLLESGYKREKVARIWTPGDENPEKVEDYEEFRRIEPPSD